jgi:mono/diheme cytochrome c family protein
LDEDEAPPRPGQLSGGGHWIFGSVYACLALLGFGFGVWAGVEGAKPRPVEVAEAKPKDSADKPLPQNPKSGPTNPTPPAANPASDPKPEPKPEPKPQPKPPAKPPEVKPEPKPKEPEPKTPAVKAVAYKDVAPIIRTYCGNCHGDAGKGKGGVDLKNLAAIRAGDKKGNPLVVPGKPDKSPLYESITSGRMPDEGKSPPPAKDLQLIRDWIAAGAKERRSVRRRGRDIRA